MSSGTKFKLLKKSRVKPEPILFESIDEKSKNNDDEFTKESLKLGFPPHEKFVVTGRDDFDVASFIDFKYYNVVSTMQFNSIMGDTREFLADEFGMDPFIPWKSQMCVDGNLATEMLIAVNYVLLEHYDRKIEEILENRFIDVFGSLSAEYSKYKYRLMFPNDTEETGYDDFKSILTEIRSILTVFLNSEERDDYVLVAEIW